MLRAGAEAEAPLYTVVATMTGAQLKGARYQPLFDYFKAEFEATAWRVCVDTYVTNDSGTGVVHQAPAFGEDDHRVCLAHGIVAKGASVPCPVDAAGRFTPEVTDFAGVHVKEADKGIMALLKERGRLVDASTIVHSYPFCWRSDTPLIYKARRPSHTHTHTLLFRSSLPNCLFLVELARSLRHPIACVTFTIICDSSGCLHCMPEGGPGYDCRCSDSVKSQDVASQLQLIRSCVVLSHAIIGQMC